MIELKDGDLSCGIEPALGGCITGLRLGHFPVLRPSPASLISARQASSYPLVPFSNRLAQATLQWQGTLYPLLRNNAAEPHAIHGVGWQRPWEVLDSDGRSALLSYEHAADDSWPFAFDCSQALRVAADSLEMTLSLTNQSNVPAPAGLGWHPFFVKRPGSHIAFEAKGRWEMGEDKLPTHRAASPGLDVDCVELDVDHCFDGWAGAVLLRDEVMQVGVRSSLTRLVVFTMPGRDSIAIEPVSHVNNALHLANGTDAANLGLMTLRPGESCTAQMSIEVRLH